MQLTTKKNVLISFSILLFLLTLTLFFIFIYKNSLFKKDRELLQTYLSNQPGKNLPIKYFPGKILSVEKNAILVAQTFTTVGQTQNITFKVLITNKTVFNNTASVDNSINYIFQNNTATTSSKSKDLSFKDLKPNQEIVVYSDEDLWTLKSNEFEASSITLQPIINTVYGKITGIKGNLISIRGFPPNMYDTTQTTPLKDNDYVITITPQTEISSLSEQGTGIKFSLDDLKVGNYINVYTKVDTRSMFTFEAMRIEPFTEQPLPTPPIISPIDTLNTQIPKIK